MTEKHSTTRRPDVLRSDVFDPGVETRLMSGLVANKGTGCWEWSRSRNDHGYGIIRITNQKWEWCERCHRVSYALFVGPIPSGKCVLHSCDNPPCFNPKHLFLGTAQDNTNDMHAKGRWRTPRRLMGAEAGSALLSEAQVYEAVGRTLLGESRSSIGRDFGVTISTVSKLLVGGNWKHITAQFNIPKSPRGIRKVG